MEGGPMRDNSHQVGERWVGPHFHIHSYQLKCNDLQLKCEGLHPSLTNLVRVSLT